MKKNERLIVITGGAGFIGSCLARYLNDLGLNNLVLVDQLGSTEKWKNLVGKNTADILDKSQLFEWLKGKEARIESIVHLGACSTTVELNASYLLENNYRYTQQLAEYAINHDIPFIYASSAATYGDGNEGFIDDHASLEILRPLNMYGYSKQLFDLWAKNQGVLDKVTGLKFFNVFGPNEQHKGRMASAILHMLPTARKEGVIRLFKSNDPKFPDGGQQRDFIYSKDVVRMIHAFVVNGAKGIYNVGTGIPNSWNALAEALFRALGLAPQIQYIEMPADLHGKYQNYTAADMRKTKAVLGKAAECVSLDESVADYVQNHLLIGRSW
ncbi:MAG: ADP-glyceromanno-heptose 6-epimerase [Parachlamydiaceae bacterium]|nr:ADP-glyceromanno-heptose 6-epimerase [Parachlamydiaceae bacterium]